MIIFAMIRAAMREGKHAWCHWNWSEGFGKDDILEGGKTGLRGGKASMWLYGVVSYAFVEWTKCFQRRYWAWMFKLKEGCGKWLPALLTTLQSRMT